MKTMEDQIRQLYSLLSKGQYKDVYELTSGDRLTVDEIAQAINEYGEALIDYPENIDLDIIEVTNSQPKSWSVIAPVYTKTEGLSDLSLELTVYIGAYDDYSMSLDNIYVR